MPLLFTQNIDEHTKMALWLIAESEAFFTEKVSISKNIRHPHKRLQHLCGRYLLQYLEPGFPLIEIVAEQNNKPFLPGNQFHFSISHCDDYVAAIISDKQQVGIDVETVGENVLHIRHKFLAAAEEAALAMHKALMSEPQLLTLAWSGKESMFKWLGKAGIDFKAHLQLINLLPEPQKAVGSIAAKTHKDEEHAVKIQYRFVEENVVLTWLVTIA